MDSDSYRLLPVLLDIIRFSGTGPEIATITFSVITLLLLLACSALVSASENSFFSLSPAAVVEMRESHEPRFKAASYLLDHPKVLLATILIVNNFVNVAVVMVSTLIMGTLLDFSANPTTGFIIQVILVSFIIVMIGEVMPKIYATQNPMGIVKIMARPLMALRRLFQPFVYLLVNSTTIIDKRITKKGHIVSLDELNHAIDITSDKDTPQEEKDILKRVVNFNNIPVKQIMKSRLDVVAIESSIKLSELVTLINEWGYSRLPVYRETFDNILGVVYIKDLLPHIGRSDDGGWKHLVRPAFFVPESKKINDLLNEFREKRIHMAIVVDEYGGTSGIVTMEDVLEEIFGEINDEFDIDEVSYSQLDDHTYIFEGKMLINDMCRVAGIESDIFEDVRGESDTLAGLVMELAGKIPNRGQKLQYEGFTLIVESVDKRRVKRVKFILPLPEESQT